jgi:hypothetical protein
LRPVPHDPIQKRPLETNIMPGLLTFNPLVTENFFPLGKEFLVEDRIF